VPLIVLLIPIYNWMEHDLTQATLARRETIASLSATVVQERLDHLVDVGRSLAGRIQFRTFIAEGKWGNAVKILESVPSDFPVIERVFLADTDGTLMADTPELPGVRGKNFADRDWYRGIDRTKEPYVSEVYKRSAEPRYNVIAIAIPIYENAQVPQRALGILVLQVKLESIMQWIRDIEVGEAGFVYIVDQRGHLVAHPRFPVQDDIIDFSSVPVVQNALRGQRGISVVYNPIEKEKRLAAYEPVKRYGWGVIVTQPEDLAFLQRNSNMQRVMGIYIFALLISTLFALRIVSATMKLRVAKERADRETANAHKFQQAVSASLSATVITDSETKIHYINPACEKLYGLTLDEVKGKEASAVFIPSDQQSTFEPRFIEKIIKGEVFDTDELVSLRKDGSRFNTHVTIYPVKEKEQVLFFVAIIEDITEKKRVDQAKSDFVSLASHQLRTPITALRLAIETLLKGIVGSVSEPQRDILTRAQRYAIHLAETVSALLYVSRVEAGTVRLEEDAVKLDVLLKEIEDEHRTEFEIQKQEVVIDCPSNLSIHTDRKLLKEIITNLMSNAIKYTSAQGRVSIVLSQEKDKIRIDVTDTGIGIPSHLQNQIFTKFFRADNAQKKKTDGTGLGLYLVASLTRILKGTISFTSEENKGTTFTLWLPLSV